MAQWLVPLVVSKSQHFMSTIKISPLHYRAKRSKYKSVQQDIVGELEQKNNKLELEKDRIEAANDQSEHLERENNMTEDDKTEASSNQLSSTSSSESTNANPLPKFKCEANSVNNELSLVANSHGSGEELIERETIPTPSAGRPPIVNSHAPSAPTEWLFWSLFWSFFHSFLISPLLGRIFSAGLSSEEQVSEESKVVVVQPTTSSCPTVVQVGWTAWTRDIGDKMEHYYSVSSLALCQSSSKGRGYLRTVFCQLHIKICIFLFQCVSTVSANYTSSPSTETTESCATTEIESWKNPSAFAKKSVDADFEHSLFEIESNVLRVILLLLCLLALLITCYLIKQVVEDDLVNPPGRGGGTDTAATTNPPENGLGNPPGRNLEDEARNPVLEGGAVLEGELGGLGGASNLPDLERRQPPVSSPLLQEQLELGSHPDIDTGLISHCCLVGQGSESSQLEFLPVELEHGCFDMPAIKPFLGACE